MFKVLHVFYDFLPHINGSCIRSAGILSGQRAQGFSIAAASLPFQPGFGTTEVEDFQGIPLYRAHRPGAPAVSDAGSSIWSRLRKVAMFPRFVLFLRRVARAERATVLHAHSTFYCAIASFLAARSLSLGFVYEFRSIWEERARGLGLVYRVQARLSSWLETLSFRLADRVVTINEGLKTEIVARGIPASKVLVAPNGVDDQLIEVGARLQPPQRVSRFGYIGTLYSNEGLDVLVEAFIRAFPEEPDVQLSFHGSGPFAAELRRVVDASKDPRIRLCGQFKREDVEAVYRSVDCVVLPRRRIRLNETVTPLKPLEAMAFNRLVGVSDVGGLLEVIGERGNAFVFGADDVDALARSLRAAHGGEMNVSAIAARGRAFVARERAWNAIAGIYRDVYADL